MSVNELWHSAMRDACLSHHQANNLSNANFETYSVSAGLDYPGVGPQLSAWKDSDRAKFVAATDAQAFEGFRLLSELEGIIPALETAHAIWGAVELAKEMDKDDDIVICLSGRGDKDVQSVADELPIIGPVIGWDLRCEYPPFVSELYFVLAVCGGERGRYADFCLV